MDRSALATFIGVYLDETLFESYSDEFDAAGAFASEQPRHAATLPAEVDELLATTTSEADLSARLRELGMSLDTNGLTYREWLTQIADRVRRDT